MTADTPTFGRYAEIPYDRMSPEQKDAYDAIISSRGYKPALPHEEAVRLMRAQRGTHFDPEVLDAFLEVSDEFARIAGRFAGAGVEPEPPAG